MSPSASAATLLARDLTVAVGPRVLLRRVDLTVGPGSRMGLVGPNGAGKSTFLQVLGGRRPPDGGGVRLAPPGATVGYLPQETRPRPGETVHDLLARRTGVAAAQREFDAATTALAAGEAEAEARYAAALDRWLALGGADLPTRSPAVFDDLGLPVDLLGRTVGRLSGGQAARVQLAALLLARFDVFLLDEPTNDLDLDGLDRLERFVAERTGPVVLVSHDRAFLERTVTAVVEIDEHAATLVRYDGGWDAYLAERARARQHAQEAYQVYVDRRETLTERAGRLRKWSQKGSRTARRSGERDKFIRFGRIEGAQQTAAGASQVERELARLTPVDKPWEGWDLHLEIRHAGRSGDVVARLHEAVVERTASPEGGRGFVLGPVDLEIGWGERVAMVGPNGSGKSTLLGALLGRVPLTSGERWLGPGVVVGEISQQRDELAGRPTLLDGFQRRSGLVTASEARSLLAKFGLGADHVARSPETLSPGERTRATLALLQARGVNLLVLDEPTNHLDLPAIEQLEQAVAGFTGTLVLVSHDRRLVETVECSRILDVDQGKVHEHR
ncbi:MAG: ABC-F family ATP-binding cassette domain-containing protein [Acidimicrobiales bacterium]